MKRDIEAKFVLTARERRWEKEVYAVSLIRAYTRPYYTISEAHEVIEAVPCNIKVRDAQKFCEEMEKLGHKASIRNDRRKEYDRNGSN